LEVTINKLSKIPLLHQPGKIFHYSLSTDVLGRVIEVVSKMNFDDYLRKNIFEPLEMN
jgi:CubicO group peptidase (beta-lactamase class C family)